MTLVEINMERVSKTSKEILSLLEKTTYAEQVIIMDGLKTARQTDFTKDTLRKMGLVK